MWEGDIIWALLTMGLVTLPGIVCCADWLIDFFPHKLLILLLLPLSIPGGVIVCTPCIIVLVVYTGTRRVVQPEWEGFTLVMATTIKMLEVTLESGPQSCLGKLWVVQGACSGARARTGTPNLNG